MNAAIGIVLGLLVAAAVIRVLENRFIFFPPRYPEGFPRGEPRALGVEEVRLTAEDGVRLNAWFFPHTASPKALLWFHGNAENIGYGFDQLKALTAMGVNVLGLDYRGYGKSEGSPDEAGIYRDADAAYNYLVKQKGFQPGNVFVYGHSLGGAVAIDLASRRECGGLIAESTFTTGREMARRMLLVPFFEYIPKSRFDSLGKIGKVRAPVLIAHGTADSEIPFSMGRRLYEAAPEPKWFLPAKGAGHNDVFLTAGERYLERLREMMGLPATGTRNP